MECGAGDGGACELDGFEFGDWGEGAGAADLDGDIFKKRGGLFGGEFVGDDGSGGFGGGAGGFLEFEVVELDDSAIGAVSERFFDAMELFYIIPCGFDAMGEPVFFLGGEAPGFEGLVGFELSFEEGGFAVADAVEDDGEFAFAGFFGVEEFDGPGGEVSGVGVEGEVFFFAEAVDAFKFVLADVDFAADFDDFWVVGAFEVKGEAVDGFGVCGNVVAGCTISASDGANELSVLIGEADGHAVDFGFYDVVESGLFEEALEAFIEFE